MAANVNTIETWAEAFARTADANQTPAEALASAVASSTEHIAQGLADG